jgi:NAD(P)H-dependent FMN reductase
MKLLMFAASLREESVNKKLIKVAAKIAQDQGALVDLVDYSKFTAENYNADVQNSTGFPAEITHFVESLQKNDGLVISSPEYNFSTPGTLKNLIDWVSRLDPMPWKGYPILLMSASPSLVGGNRGLWSTRIPLETCGGFLFPDMFSLASAHTAFNENGQLKDQTLFDRLSQNIAGFIPYVTSIKNCFGVTS